MNIFFELFGIVGALFNVIFTVVIPNIFSAVLNFIPVYKFISSINDYLICGLLGLPIIPLSIFLIKFVRKNIVKSVKQ